MAFTIIPPPPLIKMFYKACVWDSEKSMRNIFELLNYNYYLNN